MRTEHLEIAIPIICLDLVLMVNHFAKLKFPTYLSLSFPAMNKFSRVCESEIAMYISIGFLGHENYLKRHLIAISTKAQFRAIYH
jgi:hypothetical protein